MVWVNGDQLGVSFIARGRAPKRAAKEKAQN
jgi:hypothetical protein